MEEDIFMESGEDYHMKRMGMLIVLLMGAYHKILVFSTQGVIKTSFPKGCMSSFCFGVLRQSEIKFLMSSLKVVFFKGDQ